MTQRNIRITAFESRSVLLIAGFTLALAGSAYAQSTAAPAAPAGDADVTAAFTKADKNGDGKLTREEAAALPAVAVAFDRIDADKDGAISGSEFAKAMKM